MSGVTLDRELDTRAIDFVIRMIEDFDITYDKMCKVDVDNNVEFQLFLNGVKTNTFVLTTISSSEWCVERFGLLLQEDGDNLLTEAGDNLRWV